MAVLWTQWGYGFESTTVETSCSLSIDAQALVPNKNTLVSTIASSNDANDRATASVTNYGLLPSNDQGRIKFRFNTGSRALTSAVDNHTILMVYNREGSPISVIDLYINNISGRLGLFSSAGTLRATSLNTLGGSGPNLQPYRDYDIEVAWFGSTGGSGYRRLWVDGALAFEDTGLTMVATDDCDSGELRVGIDHYDGSDASGFSHSYRWAQLSNDGSEVLNNPSAPRPDFESGRFGGRRGSW